MSQPLSTIKITGLNSCFCKLQKVAEVITEGIFILFKESDSDIVHQLRMSYECQEDLPDPIIFTIRDEQFFQEIRNNGELVNYVSINTLKSPINKELSKNILSELKLGHLRDFTYISMLSRLLTINLLNSVRDSNQKLPGLSLIHIENIQQFIIDNLDRHISLEELATTLEMSRAQFSKLFRSSFGSSPYNYINGVKMQKARNMLQNDDISIIQIGMKVGFDNPSHFSRSFKRYYGLSPKKYVREVMRK